MTQRSSFVGVLLCFASLALPMTLRAQQCLEPGFKVELLAAVPEIEHPSVVTCDDAGNLFVGEDPMDMRGPTTKEFDRVLRLTFDAEGKIASKTVYCDNLSAVFGLIWHDDALYVLHAPHYTRFRDLDGDGVAEERVELADGFGPPAGVFGFNDHIVTGTRRGLDGRVYVSVGDKGVQLATGSDGSSITLEGGGVVSMTIDGRELEVVSSGTRNHLDVAMDSLDRIFTYDNTDDGLGWWTRFTHHVPSGYYGYPYDYHPHPERHLPIISEHGGGSPVGADCYREAVWPEQYRDAAFHCEWGKGKVQLFKLTPSGATFTAEMTDFLVPEPGSDFRPQDLCFSPDGRTMYVADWNFGGWTQNKLAGRLYRVTYVGDDAGQAPEVLPVAISSMNAEQAAEYLGSESYSLRRAAQDRLAREGRAAIALLAHRIEGTPREAVHSLWAAATIAQEDADAIDVVFKALEHSNAKVRAQATRALGWLLATRVPAQVSVSEHIYREKTLGDSLAAQQVRGVEALVARLGDEDAETRMHATIALGRIAAPQATRAVALQCQDSDQFVRFVARRALRSLASWSELEPLVVASEPDLTREWVLSAIGVYDAGAVRFLSRVAVEGSSESVRGEAVAALAEVERKADPYVQGWWGTRPAAGEPARKRVHEWEGTSLVLVGIREALGSPIESVRLAAIQAQRLINDPESLEQVRAAVASDQPIAIRTAAIEVLAIRRDSGAIAALTDALSDPQTPDDLQRVIVSAIRAIGGEDGARTLTGLVGKEQTADATMVAAIEALTELKHSAARSAIARRVHHASGAVRSAALTALVELEGPESAERLKGALSDEEVSVRIAALRGLGRLQIVEAVPQMIDAFANEATRQEAGLALGGLANRSALGVYLQMLVDRNPVLRDAAATALLRLKGEIVDDLRSLAERNELSVEARRELAALYSQPAPIQRWQFLGAWSKEVEETPIALNEEPDYSQPVRMGDREFHWQLVETDHPQGMVDPARYVDNTSQVWALAVATFEQNEPGVLRWMVGSDDQAVLWIDGEKVYEHLGDRGWSVDQGSGEIQVGAGKHVIMLKNGNSGGGWQYSLSLGGTDPAFAFLNSDVPPALDLAAYRAHALESAGDAVRGRELFHAANGIGCAKCHSVSQETTADIGPNLLAVGTKYPREELIRSVLEPSNRIFTGYEMEVIETDAGETFQGVVRKETDEELVLGDSRGELITIAKETIVFREKSNLSAMPNGLEKGMTLEDFADLIAYLESLKE